MIGMEHLHDNLYIVCAGNLSTDRAIVNQLSTAMQSRLIHLEMVISHKDFMEHATKKDFDYRMRAYLEFSPSSLHMFKPDHQDKTFPCPRTWEFVSKLIKGKSYDKVNLKLLGGTISEGMATQFYTFLSEYEKIPTMRAILADPEHINIPYELSTRFAIVSMLIDRFKEDEFSDLVPFIKRFTPEFQVIYYRGVVLKYPKFRRNKEYIQSSHHLLKFLNDKEVSDENDSRATNAA